MADFVGRQDELDLLARELKQVRQGVGRERPGRCLLVRGRRRVGKSRLIETFAHRSNVPFLYFTATGDAKDFELDRFLDDAQTSSIPTDLLVAGNPQNWDAAFRLLANELPDNQASIVIIDELPYLMDPEHAFEGILQRSWDRYFEKKPVLLILIGSDLSMMEALDDYRRPFHQRGRELVIGPLNPADIGKMLDLNPADAFDAALISGGLPLICAEWTLGQGLWEFLAEALNNPTSALLVSVERLLAAEFPRQTQARKVLSAIGAGERTFTTIAKAAGGLGATPLHRSLNILIDKRLVAGELPLSTRPSKERRYRITDPYLRFWLQFIAPHMSEIERGRGDLTLDRIQRGWASWRGRTIEPLVRDALARILPDDSLPTAPAIGSYWTRSKDIEIDIVGADRAPITQELFFVGSIKWLDNAAFDDHDFAALLRHRAALTTEPLLTVAISRNKIACTTVDAAYTAADLIKAWAR